MERQHRFDGSGFQGSAETGVKTGISPPENEKSIPSGIVPREMKPGIVKRGNPMGQSENRPLIDTNTGKIITFFPQ